ncbi:disease resistance protein RPV1-like [Eucalyptus grandis]|uniref:disease resistance protein RPV1-like n=1 Tax=Eucalyptus grandis TaxID=71139 RepID=UPI00192EE473|nr:disease resistance protein RPV1-like [Eucalyptus grandis]
MASSASPSDATNGPVLSLINKRLCALRKEHSRILQVEGSIAQGKTINKEQEDVLRSKPSVLASIDELEKLRPQLSSALQEELSLAAQRLPRDDDAPEKGEANNNAAANHGTAGGASSTHPSTEGQGRATSLGYDYEVFLSFHGPDTRPGFTDFLYTNLDDAGIRTFKDDKELRVGEEFAPELLEAIKQSKISIPIFSKGYASSPWCLKELVQMVDCQQVGRQTIMPIFYDVAPSEVRYQNEGYAKAFLSHEEKGRYSEETISQWKAALNVVGAINGWDLHNKEKNRREGEFARTVIQEISNMLSKAYPEVSDSLVCIDHHVDAIMKMIGAETSETRIIGIHGMGGIGKTTIAKVIYNKLSHDFENHCFLRDIRETSKGNGIQCLQNQLIYDILKKKCVDIKDADKGTQIIKERLSNKRVLLVLDDVEKENHIDALVGKCDWLHRGSKIIVTTRNGAIVCPPKVDHSYELRRMDDDLSLKLFSKHAFQKDSPLDVYIHQSKRAISIAGGLPLALKVIGSLLFHIKKEKWDSKLEELENVPPEDVQSMLKISYNALRVREKHIFLDIACLFIGYDKDTVVHFWDKSKFFPDKALEVLQNMSLISIEKDNKVWMHDQLRDLGREIVFEQSNLKIEKQSRVWNPKEGLDLLRRHKGKRKVEALRLKLDHRRQYRFTCEGFESLSHLRFLEVDGSKENFCAEERLYWHESPSNVLPTNENSDFLPQLRWLSWRDIPPTFNITNFFVEDVVILDLSWSEITDDWKGWNHMKVMKILKVLDLSHCQKLQMLPDELGRDLASLEYLYLKCCKSLQRLPNSIGNLKSLIELDISSTMIKELPDCIGKLKNLKKVKMSYCDISTIPNALWTIENLEEIVAKCTSFCRVHVNIGSCIYMRILRLNGADICALPRLPESLIELQLSELNMDTFPDLSNLTNLKEFDLGFGRPDYDGKSNGLVEYPIPQWIGNLSKLESLALESHYVTTSTDISLPPQLKSLCLKCSNLRCLPRLPSSLSSLHISRATITKIQDLGCLENLRDLQLMSLGQVEILPDLSNLNKLQRLQVGFCNHLVEIQGELPRCLDRLHISSCDSLQKLPDLSSLMGEQDVEIKNCRKLNVEAIHGFVQKNPRNLQLVGFEQLQILLDLSNLKELKRLRVENCCYLVEIQGELPQSLEELEISSCESLQKLPDLSTLKGLRRVKMYRCGKLKKDEIRWLCLKKGVEFVG